MVSMSERGVTLCESVAFANLLRISAIACLNVLASIAGSNVSGRSFSASDHLNCDRQIRICETSMSEYVVTLVEWDNARR